MQYLYRIRNNCDHSGCGLWFDVVNMVSQYYGYYRLLYLNYYDDNIVHAGRMTRYY